MTVRPPAEYRIGDRLRLRKVHPCGGWTWNVVRLGADIGLVCETCGRRILLDRQTLERRTKTWLEHGPQVTPSAPTPETDSVLPVALQIGDVLRPSATVTVSVVWYLASATERGSGRLGVDDPVRVTKLPGSGSLEVTLEPVEYETFERSHIPGGIRSHHSYEGYAIVADLPLLGRRFVRAEPSNH